jgi:hypothetical protein
VLRVLVFGKIAKAVCWREGSSSCFARRRVAAEEHDLGAGARIRVAGRGPAFRCGSQRDAFAREIMLKQ